MAAFAADSGCGTVVLASVTAPGTTSIAHGDAPQQQGAGARARGRHGPPRERPRDNTRRGGWMAETSRNLDIITVAEARTLDGVFAERVRRTPRAAAYREYSESESCWHDITWEQVNREVARWQHSLQRDGVQAGDRVAVMLRNCSVWVMYDQAVMGLGGVVVPLYTQDRPENVAYIVKDSGA
ncbi:MAG: hypothetical protein EHM59_16885, partial [Betaproteobacteria bacterium]